MKQSATTTPSAPPAVRWRREVITDPAEIDAIRRRIAASVEPGRFRSAWRRTLRRIATHGGRA